MHAGCSSCCRLSLAQRRPPLTPASSLSFCSVLQWPGVYSLSAAEEAEAEAGLAAAGRGAEGLVELQLCGLEFAVRWALGLLMSPLPAACPACPQLTCPSCPSSRLGCSGCVGEGAYARVYQGVDGDCADVALKHEAPPCPWEWCVQAGAVLWIRCMPHGQAPSAAQQCCQQASHPHHHSLHPVLPIPSGTFARRWRAGCRTPPPRAAALSTPARCCWASGRACWWRPWARTAACRSW